MDIQIISLSIVLLSLAVLAISLCLFWLERWKEKNDKKVIELEGLVASLSRSHHALVVAVGELGNDCWSPDPNNFDYWDDAREWEDYKRLYPNARPCSNTDFDAKFERSVKPSPGTAEQ